MLVKIKSVKYERITEIIRSSSPRINVTRYSDPGRAVIFVVVILMVTLYNRHLLVGLHSHTTTSTLFLKKPLRLLYPTIKIT